MESKKVTCDHCECDLTSTGNCEDWRLVLAPDRIPSRGGSVTLMAIQQPIKRTMHFCGVACMLRYFKGDKQWAYFLSSADDWKRKL